MKTIGGTSGRHFLQWGIWGMSLSVKSSHRHPIRFRTVKKFFRKNHDIPIHNDSRPFLFSPYKQYKNKFYYGEQLMKKRENGQLPGVHSPNFLFIDSGARGAMLVYTWWSIHPHLQGQATFASWRQSIGSRKMNTASSLYQLYTMPILVQLKTPLWFEQCWQVFTAWIEIWWTDDVVEDICNIVWTFLNGYH